MKTSTARLIHYPSSKSTKTAPKTAPRGPFPVPLSYRPRPPITELDNAALLAILDAHPMSGRATREIIRRWKESLMKTILPEPKNPTIGIEVQELLTISKAIDAALDALESD